MIIPLGHDQTEVRRLPWVTFTIMGLCILVHLLVCFAPGASEWDVGEDLTEAMEYWMFHPYLEMPPELKEQLLQGGDEEEFESWRTILQANADLKPPEPTLSMEQEELNRRVAAALAGMEELPIRKYGLVPARMTTLTLFTHMFFHVGWLHLLGNLFFLYLTGPFIEDVWGRPVFLGFYLLGGVVSGGLFALRYADLNIPLVGASGAIAACMGAFLIRYWHINIKFFYWIGFFFRGTFKAPAWLMLPLWLLREVFSATMMDSLDPSGKSGGTAFWAHVWGFLFGTGIGLAMKFFSIESKFIDKAIEAKTTLVSNEVVSQAMEAHDAGNTDEAMATLGNEVKTNPGNSEAVLALWSLAVGAERVAEAVPAMQRLLKEEVRKGEYDLAMTHRGELAEFAPDAVLEPAVELRLAEHLLKEEEGSRQAAMLLENALNGVTGETPAPMMTRLARLACRANDVIGRAALDRALAHPELSPEAREEFELKKEELASVPAEPAEPAAADPSFQPSAVMDGDGISIPGFEPTAVSGQEAEPETVPDISFGAVPDVGGDAPAVGADLEAMPEVPGFEPTGGAEQPAVWAAEVPPVGGDAPLPPEPAIDTSFAAPMARLGEEQPAPAAGEPSTWSLADPAKASDEEPAPAFDTSSMPRLGEELTVPDEQPAEVQAAGGMPDVELESPAESAAAIQQPALHDPVPERPVADGPASLREPGTAPAPDTVVGRPTAPPKTLELHEVEPLSLDDKRMTLDVEGQGPSALGLDKVQAVSSAVIREPGRPVSIVIDLLLDPPWATSERLRVVRMRSGRLDPSKLIPDAPNSAAALRAMIDLLLAASQGIPLPDTRAVKGSPFREFNSLQQYEQEVLQAGGTLS